MKIFKIIILLNIFIIVLKSVGLSQNEMPEIPFIENIKDTAINKQGYLYWILIKRNDDGVNIIKEYRNGISKRHYSMKYWVEYDSLKRVVTLKSNGKQNNPEVGYGIYKQCYVYDDLNRVVSYSEYRKKMLKYKFAIRMDEDFDNRTFTVYHSEDTKEIHYHNTKGMTYKTETYKLVDDKWEIISYF